MKGLLLLAAFVFATQAAAHAELVSSSPADGAALSAAPSVVELRFNEPVRPISIRLLDRSGKPLPLLQPRVEDAVLRIGIPELLGEGHYTLSFRVTSLDSHPVSGSIVFGIGARPPPPEPTVESSGFELMRIAVRAIRDLALLLAAGGALFSLFLGTFPRSLLRTTALVAAAATALGIGTQGAALLGDPHAWLGAAAWRTGLHSSFGTSACVAIGGLLAIASLRRWLMAGGAIAALGSLPLTGHALIAHPAWIAVVAVAAHALAAAFWAGSLAGLFFIVSKQPERAAAALRRFSPFGMAAVALLLAAGVTLAVLQLHGPSDLIASVYGRLIAAKAGLLALLIGLALVNRYRLLPALELGALRRSIAAELILVAAVIALTAVLVQTPPPERAQVQEQAQEQVLVSGAYTATLSVSPGRAGANVISVRLPGAAEVRIEMANPSAGIEPIARQLRRISPDLYRHEGAELAFAGAWDVTVVSRMGDFDQASFTGRVIIR